MAYPGNRDLSIEAQDRVMSAFRKVIANLQQRQREEALIGLEFVLRIDPVFAPAVELRRQLEQGAQDVDLSDLIAQLEAPTTDAINELLVEAVEDFSNRNFVAAKSKVERVLMELPGHQEGRQLLGQIQQALKVEQQVGQFLTQAREALASGDPQEAANFVLMAQALDPHHSGIAPTLHEIQAHGAGGAPPAQVGTRTSTDAEETAEDGATPWATGGDGDDLFGGAAEAAEFPAATFDLDPEPLSEPVDGDLGAPGFDVGHTPADDVADLFDAGTGPEAMPSSDNPAVAELLARGSAAFEADEMLQAIDAWSRIWLEDPGNEEVEPLIERAKRRLEHASSELQHLLFEAEDALIGGDEDKALELVDRVLAKNPSHAEALALHRRLSGEPEPKATPRPEAAPPAAAAEMPDLEDDLFSEPFADLDAAPTERELEDLEPTVDDAAEPAAPPRRRRMLAVSPRTLMLGVVAALATVVVVWLGVRAILGSREPTAETDVYLMRGEAEELFEQGKVAAAMRRVEQFEVRDEADEQVVAMLLARYRAALATPTPTPVPDQAIEAERLLAAGLWFRAYDVAQTGLTSHPGDGGLLEIVDRVEGLEPRVATLRTQLANRNHRGAVTTAGDLLEAHPGQADLAEVLGRSLFNAALAELKTYNLTGARSYLDQLTALAPPDEEVTRVLEFIDTYKARPVDMQLKVFIQSLEERLAWSAAPTAPAKPAAELPSEVEPTPTPAAAA